MEYPQSEIEVITLKKTEEENSLNVANYSLEAEVDSKKLADVNFVLASNSFQIISINIKNGIITCEFRTAIENQKIAIQAMDEDKNIIAEKTVDLPQEISEDDTGTNYKLNIDTSGEGTITPGEVPDLYKEGTEIGLKAISDKGWVFSHWEIYEYNDDIVEGSIRIVYNSATSVKMNKNHNIIAVFKEESMNPPFTINDLSKNTSGLQVTIKANVSDIDNNLSTVKIDWDDENNDTINSGFDSINESHTYAEEGTYIVKVTAEDNNGLTSSDSIEVRVVTFPEMVEVRAGTTSPDNGDLTLAYDIEMGKYEVTHAQYIKFLNDAEVREDGIYYYDGERCILIIDMYESYCAVGHDESSFYFAGSDYAVSEDTPVISVNLFGALAYCNWLSEKEGLTPAYDLDNWELKDDPENLEGYRLPTEDEWEYTARGGANGNPTTYAGSDNIDEVAWYWRNSGDEYLDGDYDVDRTDNNNCRTHPVGEKQANELGIYDMSGNVLEWTNTTDSPDSIVFYIITGGSFNSIAAGCRMATNHLFYHLCGKRKNLGFCLTRTK